MVRLEEEGAFSVVAAVTEGLGDDEAESVGPAKKQQGNCSDAESDGEVGDEPRSVACINSRGR